VAISDELSKLQGLHASGALTDDEYRKAKSALLAGNGARTGTNWSKVLVLGILGAVGLALVLMLLAGTLFFNLRSSRDRESLEIEPIPDR
jgi:hypothetical protein